MKKIKFENLGKKNPEIRHLPTNHPDNDDESSVVFPACAVTRSMTRKRIFLS